ncbi:hypothetical protein [Reinekea sp.]|jgi:hypothetical protein|uniref:hypothetical protein n=1 Tax=Reinekea sp. TaxID=1970455 RepID=UPI00398A2F9A
MKAQIDSTHTKFAKSAMKALVIAGASLSLMGCYVDVYGEYEPDRYYPPVHHSDITDLSTQLIVDAALLPLALAAEAPYQVIDPDSYTSPRSIALTRAHVTETTYAYLFDNVDCAEGGYTQVEAEADTTSYSDGFTYVDIQTAAQAHQCQVWRDRDMATINSNLSYDSVGWYDDIDNKLTSLDSEFKGDFNLSWKNKAIRHQNIKASTVALNFKDFTIDLSSATRLNDGSTSEQSSLVTTRKVHWYLGAKHPHLGEMKFIQGLDWVKLTFEANGVWRQNSQGYANYWSWSELGN